TGMVRGDEPAEKPQPEQQASEQSGSEQSGSELSDLEQAFVALLDGAVLNGTFTVDAKRDQAPKPEKYTINGVRKVSGDNWIVEARITYGKLDVPVPVPVKVNWAGDTPMIQVTDLTIPLVGDGFSSRVLFYDGRYAGTWQHGKVGGHMFGIVEKVAKEKPVAPKRPATDAGDSDS
ncbi:MAG: hypothetical protein KDA80_21845, partial [Planctomycetaceae bacterium]|nr:hypothetical protein [Planctomycetaceae bacterium]